MQCSYIIKNQRNCNYPSRYLTFFPPTGGYFCTRHAKEFHEQIRPNTAGRRLLFSSEPPKISITSLSTLIIAACLCMQINTSASPLRMCTMQFIEGTTDIYIDGGLFGVRREYTRNDESGSQIVTTTLIESHSGYPIKWHRSNLVSNVQSDIFEFLTKLQLIAHTYVKMPGLPKISKQKIAQS